MTPKPHQTLPSVMQVKVRAAVFPQDKETVSALFLAYAGSIPVDLDYQNFKDELAGLPGKYAEQRGGAVFLAETADNEAIGIVALRNFAVEGSETPTCELKRLYLAPASRGKGVAKMLMDAVLARAREMGHQEMLLDTLSSMAAARKLYENYGFQEIPSYYASVDDAVFYKLVLRMLISPPPT